MSNIKPIEPFCCDMSEATEEEVRELHRICLEAGANLYDSEEDFVYEMNEYPYKGVDEDNDIISYGLTSCFEGNLIPFNQVSEYLGLPTKTTVDTPLTSLNTTPNESHTECVKRAVWTPECVKRGIQYQVGMQVCIESANVEGDCILVAAIGKEFVLLNVDGKENCVRKEEVLPYKEVVLSQRDKVMAYLEQEFDEEDSSKIYNEILKLGVFKEDGEYAEQ